jgi:hypothetical protein
MRRIVITDVAIRTIVTDRPGQRIYDIPGPSKWLDGKPKMFDPTVSMEQVELMPYKTNRGEEIYLAMTKAVQDAIGTPLGAIATLRTQLDISRGETYRTSGQLVMSRSDVSNLRNMIVNATLWERFKFLFTGDL